MRFVILGAPGSGKGTLAAELTKEYKIPHISTGDIFRANIKNKTALGNEAKIYIEQGKLVPDRITISMLNDRIKQDDCNSGFLLDGFPRNISQAEALSKILSEMNSALDGVILAEVSHETIKDRVSARRVCTACGASYNMKYKPPKVENVCDDCSAKVIQRADDDPDTVQIRLNTYEEQTAPLIDFYDKQNLLIHANNETDYHKALDQIREGMKNRGLV